MIKKTLKKFSVIALAFTLLGTGNAISRESHYSISAHAATCSHYNCRRYVSYGNDWEFCHYISYISGINETTYVGEVQVRYDYIKCANCNSIINPRYAYKSVYYNNPIIK